MLRPIVAVVAAVAISPTAFAETFVLEAEADTMIRTDLDARRNDNHGCDYMIAVGGSRGGGGIPYGGADGIRTLVRFDLSGITEAVTSAVLEMRILHVHSFAPPQIYQLDVHRIVDSGALTPWNEGNGSERSVRPAGCEWTDQAFGVAWVGAGDGGDANNETQPNFDPTVVARRIFDEANMPGGGTAIGTGEVIQWDITSLVNDWISGAVPNHGVLIRDVTTDMTFKHVIFSGKEGLMYPNEYTDNRIRQGPTLVLNGTPPQDADGDSYAVPDDCDDSDASIHPGATDVKNDGIDQDCNGFDLTIEVTQADYSYAQDVLTVVATSGVGANANLSLSNFGPMTWNEILGQWEFASATGGYDPGTVTVCGIEGCETASTTADATVLEAEADTMIRTDLDARRNDNHGCDYMIAVGGSRGGGGIPYGGADGIRTLLRFDVSGITQPVTSAVLEMTILRAHSFAPPQIYQLDVHRIVDSAPLTPWVEGNGAERYTRPAACSWVDQADGVAWVGAGDGGDANNQTQPNFDSNVEATRIVDEALLPGSDSTLGTGEVVRWDVTDLVNGWITGQYPNHGMFLRDITTDMTFKHIIFSGKEGLIYEDIWQDSRIGPGPRLVLAAGPVLDVDGDGVYPPADCDNNDAAIYPGAPEIRHDGVDQDCNGSDMTTEILQAYYDSKKDMVTVIATSALASGAALDVTGLGAMNWKSNREQWELVESNAGGNPGPITVCGIEGCVSAVVHEFNFEQHQFAFVDASGAILDPPGEERVLEGVSTSDTLRLRLVFKDNGTSVQDAFVRLRVYKSFNDFVDKVNYRYVSYPGQGEDWEWWDGCAAGTWCDHGTALTTAVTADHGPLPGFAFESDGTFTWNPPGNSSGSENNFNIRYVGTNGTVKEFWFQYEIDGVPVNHGGMHYGANREPMIRTAIPFNFEQHQFAFVDANGGMLTPPGEEIVLDGVATNDTLHMRLTFKDNGTSVENAPVRLRYYTSFEDFDGDTNYEYVEAAGLGTDWEWWDGCSAGTWCEDGTQLTSVVTSDHNPQPGFSFEGDSTTFTWKPNDNASGCENNFNIKYVGPAGLRDFWFRYEIYGEAIPYGNMHYGANKDPIVRIAP